MHATDSFAPRMWPVFLAMAVPASAFGPVPMGIAILVALFFLLLHQRSMSALGLALPRPHKSALSIAIVCLIASWLVSTLDSLDFVKSIGTWFRVVFFLGFSVYVFIIFTVFPGCVERFKKASILAALAVLFYIIVSIYLFPSLFEPIALLKGHEKTINQVFKGHGSTVVCVLPLLVWSAWTLNGTWRYAIFPLVILTLALVYNDGREMSLSGLAGLIGGLTAVGFALAVASVKRGTGYILWVGATIVAIGIAVYVVLNLSQPPYLNHVPDNLPFIDAHRELIWSFVWDAHKAVPFFGYGPNTVNLVPGGDIVVVELNQEFIPSHPHNWIMEVLAETGWVGLLLLLSCIALLLRQAVRGMYIDRAAALAVIAGSGAFWVSGLVNFSFWTSWWQTAYLVSLVVPLAALQSSKNAEPDRADRSLS